MKNFFSELSTAFLAVALLALCSIFVAARPPGLQTMEKSDVKILVIGSPSVGATAALTARLAQHGIQAMFVVESDGDGLTVNAPETPFIVNKRDILAMTTATRGEPDIRLKVEARKGARILTEREFYDVPPNLDAYRGASFANRIRAQPQNVKS